MNIYYVLFLLVQKKVFKYRMLFRFLCFYFGTAVIDDTFIATDMDLIFSLNNKTSTLCAHVCMKLT